MEKFSPLIIIFLIFIQLLEVVIGVEERLAVQETRAECLVWSKLENRTLPLKNEGHAKCITNQECTGFTCKGLYQENDIHFGMRVLPCQDPPGVQIFGSAPQFNANNFSHVFTHKADYEVPGALLNTSMLPLDIVKPSSNSLIKGRLEIYLMMNRDSNTLTLGLNAKACINNTCLFSKPVFNRTEIPVPECPNEVGVDGKQPKGVRVNTVCSLSDIRACGPNQICIQTDIESPNGLCECLSDGFSQEENGSCVPNVEDDPGSPRLKKSAARGGIRKAKMDENFFNGGVSSSSHLSNNSNDHGGTIAAAVVSLVALALVSAVVGFVLNRTRLVPRLRAHLTSTPYEDIVIADRNRCDTHTSSVFGSNRATLETGVCNDAA